jgi:hypothetical protein
MATRISVTPDKDGLIHITCGGADLELDIGGGSGGGSTSSAGPIPKDPTHSPILSLVGRTWNTPDVVAAPLRGRPLVIHAQVIDVHALDALARKFPGEGMEPGMAAVHVDLRR